MFVSYAIRGEAVMLNADFQWVLASVPGLMPAQLAALDAAIRARMTASPSAAPTPAPIASPDPVDAPTEVPPPVTGPTLATIEARFCKAPQCPYCQSASIKKWGSANRLQRYRCKMCKVTFNALTGTPLAQLHKRELWQAHAGAFNEGISVRKAAVRLDVDPTTAFRWRHRFLKAIKALLPTTLQGTIEADETYFLYSEKGSHHLDRPARTRGGKASKRGLSDEQVPVLIARDRTKATADRILDDRSEKSIAGLLGPLIAPDAILVSDGAHAYRAFADRANILHVGLVISQGQRRWGVYHVQNVNAYTSQLKRWMRRFNGVATKYLDSYLGWHRMNDRDGDTLTANRTFIAAMGSTATSFANSALSLNLGSRFYLVACHTMAAATVTSGVPPTSCGAIFAKLQDTHVSYWLKAWRRPIHFASDSVWWPTSSASFCSRAQNKCWMRCA
jgi:transposase-like protein